LKERSQRHKILETNTWIFGEEFNLWASGRGLTTVLKVHKEKLDPDLTTTHGKEKTEWGHPPARV
jgi:hypothetical protein